MADLAYSTQVPYSYPQSSLYPGTSNDDDGHSRDDDSSSPQSSSPVSNRPEAKPQSTFLTKLYALLEKPENQNMIRWDPAGEHIIVERPEQLALHVLPSIYRQSRFASFSRQLNIYGFMRKVNLRNVDPAIDDPDASTWSHPTLNRHSPPELVATFKRRVPPRLPKPRRRADQDPPLAPLPPTLPSASLQGPRSAIGPGGSLPLPLSTSPRTRSRGLSAPGTYASPSYASPPSTSWGPPAPSHQSYHHRSAIPPLTVPTNNSYATPPPPALHPISPVDGGAQSGYGMPYTPRASDMLSQQQQHAPTYSSHGAPTPSWSFTSATNTTTSAPHAGSLSNLLNHGSHGGHPSSQSYGSSMYPPTRPTINTSYGGLQSLAPASPLSDDSRPATAGYAVDGGDVYSTGSPRALTPTTSSSRPGSAKGAYGSSLRVSRQRRHSHAVAPYPQPGYDAGRPPSAESAHEDEQRPRSMIQLPTVDASGGYYSQQQQQHHQQQHQQHQHQQPQQSFAYGNEWASSTGGRYSQGLRPSTSASSLSGASQASSSAAHTPSVSDGAYAAESGIHRYSPDFGFAVPVLDAHGQHHHHHHPSHHHPASHHHHHDDGLRGIPRYVEPAKGGR